MTKSGHTAIVIFAKIYIVLCTDTTNVAPSLTLIAHSVSEIRGFLYTHARIITLQKLHSKDVATNTGEISVY